MKRAIIFLAACAPDVPETPSFQQHIAPILAANCVRCHGVPTLGGAPPRFRLDTISSYERPKRNGVGIEPVVGVGGVDEDGRPYAMRIAERVASDDNPMPPRFSLDDYQIETLERWDALGAPRGEPKPGNRPPFASVKNVMRSLEEEGIEVRVRYLIDIFVGDPDPDLVGGALQARIGATALPLGLLHAGSNRIVWDTTNISPNAFQLEAALDDGGAQVVVPLGSIDVEAP